MSDKDLGTANHKVLGWQRYIEVPLVICGGLMIFALMGLSVSDALLRSFANKPIYGANDYIQILLSFIVALSFPLCILAARLIAIDTLVQMLPERTHKTLDWIVTVIGVAMLSYVSWRTFVNALESAKFAETTILLQLPFGPSYYALAIGCGLSALLLLVVRIKQ